MGLSHGVSRWLLEREVRQILWMPWAWPMEGSRWLLKGSGQISQDAMGLSHGGLTLIGRFQFLIPSRKQQREAPRDQPVASFHLLRPKSSSEKREPPRDKPVASHAVRRRLAFQRKRATLPQPFRQEILIKIGPVRTTDDQSQRQDQDRAR